MYIYIYISVRERACRYRVPTALIYELPSLALVFSALPFLSHDVLFLSLSLSRMFSNNNNNDNNADHEQIQVVVVVAAVAAFSLCVLYLTVTLLLSFPAVPFTNFGASGESKTKREKSTKKAKENDKYII